MAGEREQNRDLTLPPDSYLYLQNVGKGGLINVFRGPTVVNQTGQDQPVRYDSQTHSYRNCSLEQAVQTFPRANEGDYVVLENPSEDNSFPRETNNSSKPLKKGRRIVVPGPWSEALWPGQNATVIEGHRLRSNQYLVAIVVNAEEAEKNWETGTVAKIQTDAEEGEQNTKGLPRPESFAVGTRIVIKGTDVSFFIPCTGVEVVKDEKNQYVREAVTLEQMEYSCLIDESGKKEYPRGPKVVFPKATRIFDTDSKGRRKFRPIEMNTINGIHVKVTADFKGPDIEQDLSVTREFREGEELFVTGKTLAIYYPREELSIIEYGQGNKKHFSTAIPKGEGRYVINRSTGEIRIERGYRMFLADPRNDIPVRRVLSDDECTLYYPKNTEALAYNHGLAEAMASSPSGRSGVISEGDYRKHQLRSAKHALASRGGTAPLGVSASYLTADASIGADPSEYAPEEVGQEGPGTESIRRGTSYTPPRTLTLNTKYDGVPRIEVWPGYAVLVVGAEGSRRVVEGPEVVLLEYDEKLGHMELSTGKPKSTDKLYKTAYLMVQNNQVGDIIPFESKDHVKGSIKVSLRVNFEAMNAADKLKWFGVDNYVKYLMDHVRSIIAGMGKRHPIAEIKSDYVNLVRNCILGHKGAAVASSTESVSEPLNTKRPGLYFESNGMRVIEVEVLDITLSDTSIAKMLDAAQHQVVQSNIEVEAARRDLETTVAKETIEQSKAEAQAETLKFKADLKRKSIEDEINLLIAMISVELKKLDGERQKTEAKEAITDLAENAKLDRAKLEILHILETERERLVIEQQRTEFMTESAVKRFAAAKDGLSEVLVSLHRDDLATKLATGCTIERWLSGEDAASSIANLLSIAPNLKAFFDRASNLPIPGNGNRLRQSEAAPSPR